MSDELRVSSSPPHSQSEPPTASIDRAMPLDPPAPPDPVTRWTWPAVTVTCVLVVAGMFFTALLIIANNTDAKVAAGIALLLITGVVVGVMPSRRGSPLGRIAHALLQAFADDGSGRR